MLTHNLTCVMRLQKKKNANIQIVINYIQINIYCINYTVVERTVSV